MKKKGYRFYQIGFFALLLLLGLFIYANWDYMLFRFLIADHYIFTEALDEMYDEALGQERSGGYHRNFDRMVISVVTEKIRSINQDRYTHLYTPEKYQLTQEAEKTDAKTVRWEELNADTVYLYIPNISKGTKDFVVENKDSIGGYKNLVLDLRNNYGGLLADFYTMAELFLPKGACIGYEKTRFSLLTHEITSKKEPYFDYESIVILQNVNTASAAEGLILSLKNNLDNVTLIGGTTFGKGIGQVTIPLTRGYAVKATVLLVSGPGDTSVHRIGIEPDIAYEGDEYIERGLSYLEDIKR